MEAQSLVNLNYYFDGDKTIQQKMDYVYTKNININQEYWTQALIDIRTKQGDQTLWNDYYGNLPIYRNKHYFFNLVQRICNMITGYQRQHRRSSIAVPVENSDDQTASQWTKLLYHCQKGCDFDELHSDAFESGCVTTGLSYLYMWMDYSRDPLIGDPKLDVVSSTSMLIDPYFRKKDLSDANFIWYRRMLSPMAVKAIVPRDLHRFIDSISKSGTRDGKFPQMAEVYNYSLTELMTYDEYYYRDFREATFLVDYKAGLTREWKGDKEGLKSYLDLFPNVKVKKTQVPTVKLAISVQGQCIYNGQNPLKIDRYPIVPYIGYYEPDIENYAWRVTGVVRNLRDAQFLYNRRKITEMDILESQINSGFKYKPTSLIDPQDIFQKGQGKGIALKMEADMNDAQEIQPAQIPQSMAQLSESLRREIMDISGVNEELLGSAQDDKAGVLAMLRQSAGVTTLSKLFDNGDFAQRIASELFVDVIKENFSEGKIERILGEKPSDQFKYKVHMEYDIRIEEGMNTTTQKQQAFLQKLELFKLGIPVPIEDLLEDVTIQNKEKMIEKIQMQQQQAQQAEMMKAQVEMGLVQAQMKNMDAQATANLGLSAERISRIQENSELSVERRAKAIEDMTDAQLNRVKILKELQDIDLNQIQRLLEIANLLKVTGEDASAAAEGASEPVTQTGQKIPSLNMS